MISTSIYPCITEDAIARFKPTWLMIKKHNVTGLMYFCKTVGKDPIAYKGSGTRWARHLKKHGKEHVETIWCELYSDIYELVDFALTFSRDCDIVKSKEWANLIPENGLDGGWKSPTAEQLQKAGRNGGFVNRNLWSQQTVDRVSQDQSRRMKNTIKRLWVNERAKMLLGLQKAQFAAVTAAASTECNAKKRITFQLIGHQQGKKNSQYGTCWVIKDGNSIKIKTELLDEYLAQDYVKGRSCKRKNL